MDLRLKNKIALVTGSTEGIGLSIARLLAQEGATVYINGRSKEKVLKVISEHAQEGVFKAAAFDLATAEGVVALTQVIPHIDILINNLGIYEVKPFLEIKDEDWLRLFEVNVLSGIRLSRFFFPKMHEHGWGRIIFISSESGVNPPLEMIHYGMTKTAQLAVSRGLAEMTAGTQITVNSILPGPTLSPGVERFMRDLAASKNISIAEAEKQFFQNTRPSSLIKRFATADEVGALACFICSDKAAAINGAALRVDGGVIRSIV